MKKRITFHMEVDVPKPRRNVQTRGHEFEISQVVYLPDSPISLNGHPKLWLEIAYMGKKYGHLGNLHRVTVEDEE